LNVVESKRFCDIINITFEDGKILTNLQIKTVMCVDLCPFGVIPPTLHTELCLNTALFRRLSGDLQTNQCSIFIWGRVEGEWKENYFPLSSSKASSRLSAI
jgi:hypothetical protein